MPTLTLFPNGDAGPNEWTNATPHWSRLDEGTGGGGDEFTIQAEKNDDGAQDAFNMTTGSIQSGKVTQAVLQMLAQTDGSKQPTAALRTSTQNFGSKTCAWAAGQSVTVLAWTGLNLSQADVDLLKVDFFANGALSVGDTHFLEAFELVLTYTPGAMHIMDVEKFKDQIYMS